MLALQPLSGQSLCVKLRGKIKNQITIRRKHKYAPKPQFCRIKKKKKGGSGGGGVVVVVVGGFGIYRSL